MRVKTEAKRQHIVDLAAQVFREQGFEGASMAEICARAGGSKATLYNYFASKEALFFEVMAQSCDAEFDAAHQAIDVVREDIGEALNTFGQRFLGALYSPEVQAMRHLAIASSGRTELGRLVYERRVLRSQAFVSEILLAAMAQGRLRRADPGIVTRQFYALLEAEFIDRFLFQLPGEVTRDEIRDATARAVAVFMAAYGPKPAA